MPAREARKRGPRTAYGDGELTQLIRGVLEASPRLGEGYRKVWAQLRARVLRLMRRANLLAPPGAAVPTGPRPTTEPSPPTCLT